MRCPGCGGELSRRDRRCSFCGRVNDRYEPPGAEALALLARGKEAHGQGRYADAVEALAKAVERDPELYDACFFLADAWLRLGMTDRAAEAMARAQRLRPGSAAVAYDLAAIEAARGRIEEARRLYERARELAATDPALADREAFLRRVEAGLPGLG